MLRPTLLFLIMVGCMQQTLQAQAYINHFDTANLIYFENARVEDVWEKDGEVYFSLSDFANRPLDGFVGDLRDRELEFFEDKFLHNVIESEYGQFSLWIDYSKSSLDRKSTRLNSSHV